VVWSGLRERKAVMARMRQRAGAWRFMVRDLVSMDGCQG